MFAFIRWWSLYSEWKTFISQHLCVVIMKKEDVHLQGMCNKPQKGRLLEIAVAPPTCFVCWSLVLNFWWVGGSWIFWGRGSKLCSLLYLAEKNCRENRRSRGKLGSLHLSHKRSAGLYFVVHTTKLMISRNFPPSISNFGRVPFSRKLIHLPISSRIISRFDGSIKWWTIFLRRFKRSAVAEDIASNSRVSFTLCANLQFV